MRDDVPRLLGTPTDPKRRTPPYSPLLQTAAFARAGTEVLVLGPYLQDVWVLRGFSASMATKTAFLGIFTAILAAKSPYSACNAGYGHFRGKAGRKWRGSRVRAGSVCAGVCGPEGASAKGITPVFSKPFRPWKDRSRHERRLPEAHTPPRTLNLQCQIIAENR